MIEVEGCEQRALSSGEPCCNRLATHIHSIRDEDGEVFEELYMCSKHAKDCNACRPMVKESTENG